MDDGLSVARALMEDANNDGLSDLLITFSDQSQVILLGMTDLAAVTFAHS